MAEVDGSRFLGIASFGFDSDANRIANEAKLVRGNLVYLYAALRALAAWKPAALHRHRRRRARTRCPATRWPSPTRRPTAAACSSRRRPSSTTACSTSWSPASAPSSTSCAGCPRCSRARTSTCPSVTRAARRGDRRGRRPPVRDLRRRRPDRLGPGHDPRRARAACGDRAGVMVRVLEALARAGARAVAPPRPRRRHDPARAPAAAGRPATRSSGWPAGSTTARCVVSATNGKTTTSAMVAAILERAGRAGGAQPRRIEHGLGRGDRAARRRAASGARSASSRWTRRGCRASPRRCSPRTYLLSNLFRDQLDRYGELERWPTAGPSWWSAEAAGARFVLNADDPLMADLGREREGVVVLRRSTTTPRRSPSSSTRPTRSTAATAAHPYAYEAVYLGPPRPLPLPQLRPRAPRPVGGRPSACELEGMRGAACRARTPRRGRSTCGSPSPASTTSTTPSAAAALALELGRLAGRTCGGAGGLRRRLRARRDDPGRRGRPGLDPAGEEPGGGQRGAAHADARRTGEIDLWLALNDKIADGRDVSWIWDADFELLAGRVRPRDLLGHPRRGDGAAAEVRGHRRGARPWTATSSARSTPRWPPGARTGGRCTPCPPTRRCSSCATLLARRGLAGRWAD